jgi:cellulose biosynthesis protein BcsQ
MAGDSGEEKMFSNTDFALKRKNKGGSVHIANIKGGVGKTTVATNLAATLAKSDKTLIIDFDVQKNVSHALGFKKKKGGSSFILSKKYCEFLDANDKKSSNFGGFFIVFEKIERLIFGSIIGRGDISVLCGKAEKNLWIIPADNSLLSDVNYFKRQNFAHNLQILSKNFKYIVIDTPSIWNNFSKFLYIQSDLSIIPVTLDSLSISSLRDYLEHISQMSRKHSSIAVRILKNEVFGLQKSDEEDKDFQIKTRYTEDNRTFLNNLCRSFRFYKNSVAVAPEQLILNVEIPESVMFRNAQDIGVSVEEYDAKSLAAQSFAALADTVVTTLNSNRRKKRKYDVGVAKTVIFTALVFVYVEYSRKHDPVIFPQTPPKAIMPEQAKISQTKVIRHTFKKDDSVYRVAKHAVSKFVGIVPTTYELTAYINETINIHNATNYRDNYIRNADDIRPGQTLIFYPSTVLQNRVNEEMITVYNYFMKLVDDPRSYVTGDWQERGYGEDSRHDGIDVAGLLGSNVKTPISGIVINKDTPAAGRVTGVVSRADGHVVFFAHLDIRYFNTGDSVSAGTAIGTVGVTGRTSGPHAHIGFGIKTLDQSGMVYGKNRYKETDPKFLYYRQIYKESERKQ